MNNRTVEQGAQTRKRIMAAAAELFGRFGYRGCSLAQIASAADVGQSAVLHHFGSKENLLTELLEEQFAIHEDGVQKIARGDLTIADRFDDLASQTVAAPDYALLFSVISGESLTETHPARDFFIRRYNLVRDRYVAAVVENAKSSGWTVPADEVRRLVNLLVATLDGLQLQWLRNRDEVDLQGQMADVTTVVRQRLRALENRS